MSAPGIPNLRSLNFSRPIGRGRGRGRGQGTGAEVNPDDPASKDRIIQGTDQDALGSRLSAVNTGYLKDPYIKYFFKGNSQPTRFPIINRGMYLIVGSTCLLIQNRDIC
jgi:[phosphatase 2A protein]-leucine-carboxy methyltransferase